MLHYNERMILAWYNTFFKVWEVFVEPPDLFFFYVIKASTVFGHVYILQIHFLSELCGSILGNIVLWNMCTLPVNHIP